MSEAPEGNNEQFTGVEHRVIRHSARWLRSKHATAILAFISFTESVFAPIIIDPFLVALILATRARWKWYIFVATAASIVGGIFAYFLGLLFFDTIGTKLISLYGLESWMSSLSADLNDSGFVFVLLGAFTPIPYKVVALASGFLKIDILTFLIASIFGRALRLGLVGFAAYAVGPRALPVMQRNLKLFASIIGALFVLYLIAQFFFA